MKLITNIIVLIGVAAAFLVSCSGRVAAPTMTPTQPPETTTPTAVPTLVLTGTALPLNTVFPTSTFTATTKPTLLPPIESTPPIPGAVVYYYFVNVAERIPPQGSVVIMPGSLVLAPGYLDAAYGSDIAVDLRSALEAVLKDERNYWFGDRLQIKQAAYDGGHASVDLEGEYYAVAPVVLTAARAQILMTLFANAAVQSATVTINGDTIANISISNSMDAKPPDYVYTRAEIESFMAENAYVGP